MQHYTATDLKIIKEKETKKTSHLPSGGQQFRLLIILKLSGRAI